MKPILYLCALLSFGALAAPEFLSGNCAVGKSGKLKVALVENALEVSAQGSTCRAGISRGVSLDRGSLEKEILYLDLATCPKKIFRTPGFLKLEKFGAKVRGTVNVLASGPVVCEFSGVNWSKVRELSLSRP